MKYTIPGEDFSTKFMVCDVEGLARYYVTNEMNSVMRKLTIYDLGKKKHFLCFILIYFCFSLADNIVCIIEKEFFTLRPTYSVYNKNNQLVLTVRKKFNLLRPHFTISSTLDENKFRTIGNYSGSKFSIMSKDAQELIAKVARNGGYSIEILDDEHDPLALIALVIIIHLCCHSAKDE